MRGAGGTSGGLGQFFLGLAMLCGGVYLLLNSIMITSNFGFGMRMYGMGQFGITSGMILIPFMFGVGIIFYNAKNIIGWVLASGSLIALVFGVISSIQFTFRFMSAFDLIIILILAVGGLGIFLRSLKNFENM
ncbi:diguanylate cyclase/phosphodiesterase (GGDEF & EAL domains) with PAS/PAC sensor(s) [hydrothermal vent metagenome]|uniref:Diguanylate cyclase/phosphodiesterase (GGDEF & EAL domains) with PAS/PAC sensor(S) n=1 Tax=hydrothermal vent metagenome TaxID=652676 RepID=A0A3B0WV64_9ZZZZ